MKRKLLWLGDAACETGFSRITHKVVPVLAEDWDISILAINYTGDSHPLQKEYELFATDPWRDPFAYRRLGPITTRVKPDVVFLLTDPWHVPHYVKAAGNAPAIASLAVDGMNCAGRGLNGLAGAIFWTDFGEGQAGLGGYMGNSWVVPLGVDLDIYKPRDRVHARKALGLPPGLHEKGFIVGNVNRNQPRKYLDHTIAWFAEWVHENKIPDAYLYLHVLKTGDQGWDLVQLAEFYKITSRLIYPDPPSVSHGVSELALAHTYAAFDVQVTNTQGEGFGLTTLEGMACGIPQIVPDYAALGEICTQGALLVPCTSWVHTPMNINVLGGLPDREEWIACLDRLYNEPETRERLGAEGVELANRQCYRWRDIGERVADVIEQALGSPMRRTARGSDGEEQEQIHRRGADVPAAQQVGEESP